jgi:NADPH:quinone reductase-like Zn-dependent oxidoreductase
MMKAIWSSTSQHHPNSTSAHQLTITERPIPALQPSTILIKVCASGVNPSDGANGFLNSFGVSHPRIPGRDFAGIVHASNNPSLPPGTAVYGTSGNALSFTCDGTAAEYVLVPEDGVVPKPRSLTMAQAAVVGVPYTAALLALEATNTQPADRVLILGGTGAVGRAAARIARCWGSTVVTTGRRDHVADINISTDPKLHSIHKYLVNGKADVIIDTIGSAALMSKAMKLLALRGRYCVLTGCKEEPSEYNLNLVDLYRKNRTICGVNSIAHQPAEMAERMQRLAEMFDTKGLEQPAEDELTLVSIENGIEAYKQAAQFTGRKHVIVFDDN